MILIKTLFKKISNGRYYKRNRESTTPMRYTAASLSKKKKKTDTQTNNTNKKHMGGRRIIHGIRYVYYHTYLNLTSVY